MSNFLIFLIVFSNPTTSSNDLGDEEDGENQEPSSSSYSTPATHNLLGVDKASFVAISFSKILNRDSLHL